MKEVIKTGEFLLFAFVEYKSRPPQFEALFIGRKEECDDFLEKYDFATFKGGGTPPKKVSLGVIDVMALRVFDFEE